ncbi:MAG TPA: 6-bladed beta-propeller [Solirubrobacterales bacterium]|nr:6-bladed beta-propeller [Solirubrobacterales bacterium]
MTQAEVVRHNEIRALSLLLVLIGLLFGPAAAWADDSSSSQSLAAEEVSQYQSDLGTDAVTAERNLAVQQRAVGIVEHLRAALGADYAGVWFDNSAGQFVIPSHGADVRRVREVMTDEGVGGDFRIQPAAYSWAGLISAQNKLESRLHGVRGDGSFEVGLDVSRNEVSVRLASAASATTAEKVEEAVAGANGAAHLEKVRGGDLNSSDLSCDGILRSCGNPLRGAIGISVYPTEYRNICSSAFKAMGNAFGNRFLLTAGHCVKVGEVVKAQNADVEEYWRIGQTEESNRAPGDWAKINANGSQWDVSPWPSAVAYWGTSTQYAINGESASYVGQYVCFAGISENAAARCGTVEFLNNSSESSSGFREHQTMMGPTCAEEGNSGGPVFANHVALGIVSSEARPVRPCGEQHVLYSEVTEAADAMGVTVGPRLGTVPAAETEGAEAVGPHMVKFHGTVAPRAIQTNFHFNFGVSQPFTRSTLWGNAGSGWGRGPVELIGEGLKGNSRYEYVLIAQNSAGAAESWIETFTTPDWRPAVSYQPASSRTQTSATLNAKVNPQGEASTYHFEWGETTSYGNSAPVPDASVGSGTSDVAVSRALSGLKPETTYHFRVVAKNGEGTTVGPDATFTTLANTPVYASSFGTTGTANGQFSRPLAMAPDAPGGVPSGDVWVVDKLNNRVEKFNSKGEYLTKFGSFGTGDGQFNEPRAIAVDDQGNLWVADAGNHRVEKFNATGEYLSQIVREPSSPFHQDLEIPSGVAIGREGHLFVSDQGNSGEIDELRTTPDSSGHYLIENYWGVTGPASMATDPQGDVWVVDQSENKLYEIPSSGGGPVARFGTTGTAPGQLSAPYGVAVKPSGALLVSDRGNNRIEQFSQTGELLASFGKAGGEAGQFCEPSGLALSSRGVVFVADACHDKVQRWNQQTSPEAVTQPATGNTATGATLNARVNPSGLATTYRFEWGKTTAYGSSIPASPGSLTAGFADSAIAVPLTGLVPDTTYHRRIVATNSEGTTYGKDRSFETKSGTATFASSFGSLGSGNGQLSRPLAVAPDAPGGVPSGNVWVVDKENNRVEKFNSKGEYLSQFGSFGTGNGQFNSPRAITVDGAGNLWVTDAGNHRIEKFSSSGSYLMQIGQEAPPIGSGLDLEIPSGIAVGGEGHIFVSDQGNGGQIDVLNPTAAEGRRLVQVFGAGTNPINMATDPDGVVWFVDYTENKVYEVPASGGFPVARFGTAGAGAGQLSGPFGIAFKPNGNLLISDRANNRIEQFSPSGTFQLQFGSVGSGAGQLSEPSGVAIGPDGSVYVADANNNRISRWTFK